MLNKYSTVLSVLFEEGHVPKEKLAQHRRAKPSPGFF